MAKKDILDILMGAVKTGQEFFNAATVIANAVKKNIDLTPPAICNFALSSELFLKGNLAMLGINPGRNHELLKLFELFPEKDKICIAKEFCNLRELIYEEDKDYVLYLISELSEISKMFVQSRYWHEDYTLPIKETVPDFAVALYNYTYPDFKKERNIFWL